MNDLVVNPHPLTTAGRTTRAVLLVPGETLTTFLKRAEVDLIGPGWVVSIGGRDVPAYLWPRTRPKHGMVIECRRVAQKDVLRVVAFIGLAYVTLGGGLFAGGIGGALGLTGFAAAAVNFGAYMVGSLIINKLLPPTRARAPVYNDSSMASTFSLSGGRNRSRPYDPLGLVFGVTKVVPDYAALPYSSFESDEQYQYVRLQGDINSGAVAMLQIGDTAIGSYQDVTVAYSGFPDMTAQPLLAWDDVDSVAGATLTAPSLPASYTTRTSSTNATRLAIDVGAQLYNMADDGSFASAQVDFSAERRLLPGGAWVAFANGVTNYSLFSTGTKPVRRTILSEELTPGQYEVRLRKTSLDVSTTRLSNALEWGVLKTYQADSGVYDAYPQVGIRIKASGQLNGALDEVNWIATAAQTPVWNGSAWVTQATRNPGAQMLQFARGIFDADSRLIAGMGLPDSQIDIDAFKAFMVHCAAEGHTFDWRFEQAVGCLDVLEAMAVCGLGTVSYHPGKLSVVWATADDPLQHVVNMANIKRGTFRVDYATRNTAEELEVTWFDRDDGWRSKSLRVLAPGVTVPRDTARLAPVGVTTEAGAALRGRFVMGQNIYQRKSVTWDMDLEHLRFRRMDVIALSHDLTQWGYGGRLRAAVAPGGVVTITLDQAVPWNTLASTRSVGLRVPGQLGMHLFTVAAFTGDTDTLTLVESWPGGVPFPGDSAANPAHDTLWMYDFAATPGQRLRVASIEPSDSLGGARITAVPETAEFWTFVETGVYTVPPARPAPVALAASNVQVTRERITLNYDLTSDLAVTFDAVGPFDSAQLWGAPAGNALKLISTTRTRRFPNWRVGADGSFDIEVRPFDELGRLGVVATLTYALSLDDPLAGGNGVSVYLATVYKQSATAPAAPTGGSFNFSTGTLTAPSGWTTTQPDTTATPTYACEFYFSTSTPSTTVTAGTWTTPYIDAVIGSAATDGQSVFVIEIYKQAASAPATPTGGSYTFSTDSFTAPSTWSRSQPTSSTTPTWRSSFRFATNTPGTPVAAGTWSAPVKTAVDGVDGTSAKAVAITATSLVFRVNKAGVATPTSVSITAAGQNLTGSPSWATSPAATLGGAANATTRTLSYTNMGANDAVEVTGTWDGQSDKVTIVKVREGTDGLTPILGNAAHTLPSSNTGVVSSYTGSGTTLQVYEGSTLLTYRTTLAASSFTIGAPTVSPAAAITVGAITGSTTTTATVAAHSAASSAQDVITITYPITVRRADGTDSTLSVVQTLTKSKTGAAGADGADAPFLNLVPTAQTFTFDGDDLPAPSSQTISFTANLVNLTGTATFTCTRFDLAGTSLGTVTMGGTGNTRTLTSAQFDDAYRAVVSATRSGFTDQVTVVRLRDGAKGYTALLTNEAATLAASSTGVVGSFATAGGEMKVWKGDDELTSGVTYSVLSSSGLTITINSTSGVYSVSAMTADDATATLRAIVTGGPTFLRNYTAAKSRAGVDGQTGNKITLAYRRASTQPATPTGNNIPSGWSASLPAPNGQAGFMSQAEQTPAGVTQGVWSTPRKIDAGAADQPKNFVATSDYTGFATGIAAVAEISIEINGTVEARDASGAYPVVDGWYAPTGGTPGNTHLVKVIQTSGSALALGTLDTWLPLTSPRVYRLSQPVVGGFGQKQATLVFYIAASGSDVILATGQGVIRAAYEA